MIPGLTNYFNTALAGWPYHADGFIAGPEQMAADVLEGEAVLSYEAIYPDSLITLEDHRVIVFRRGEFASVENANMALVLPRSTATDGYDIVYGWPVRANETLNAEFSDCALFEIAAIGDRVKVSWTDIPDEDDFASYRIYRNAGDGSTPSILAATVTRREQTEAIISSLGAGTFKFALTYVDRYGNESAIDLAEVDTVTTAVAPVTPTVSDYDFDHDTHCLTVTFGASGAYRIYSNYLWGEGLKDQINWEYPFSNCIGASWTSRPLWEGRWRFAITRHAHYGLESVPETIEFRLLEDGAALVDYADFGVVSNALAVQTDADELTIEWAWTGAGTDEVFADVELSDDGVNYVHQDYVAYTTTELAISSLVGGTEYTARVRPVFIQADPAVEIDGEWAYADAITLDGTAPVGDAAITVEAIL